MNLKGSYRALRDNSKAALMSAIEIYNKPTFDYRDECFVILLVNAWELMLKAILSKNKMPIFYKKQRNKPYITLSVQDALTKAKPFFPNHIPFEPVEKNLSLLIAYRNNAVHFYNQKGFGVLIYNLAQASVLNFRDLMEYTFSINLANEITLNLLPLALGVSLDPVSYIQNTNKNPKRNRAVTEFVNEIVSSITELDSTGFDTSRLLTVLSVKLESVKKVSSADVLVGITSGGQHTEPLIIEKRFDPNDPNWGRQIEVLNRLPKTLHGIRITSYVFQAVVWKNDIKNNPHLCWRSKEGTLTKYSFEVASLIKRLSREELVNTIDEFRENNRRKLQRQ